MATARKQTPRAPLKPRPRPNAKAEEIFDEIEKRYPKTLGYLGR